MSRYDPIEDGRAVAFKAYRAGTLFTAKGELTGKSRRLVNMCLDLAEHGDDDAGPYAKAFYAEYTRILGAMG